MDRLRPRPSRRTAVDFSLHPLEPRKLLAAAYYVSPSGDDSNDGRSPETAWRTIDRANGRNWNPGDALLFEGGHTFNVTGSAGANVVVNSSFAEGLTGWTDTLGTAVDASTVNPIAGADGGPTLQIAGAAAGSRAQDVTALLSGNQAYKMSFQTLVENPGAGLRRIGVTFELGGEKVATYYRGFQNTDWDETRFAFVAPAAFDRAYVWVTRSGDSSTVYADDITLNSIPNGIVLDVNDSGTIEYPLIVSSYGGGKATINAGDGIGLWGHNVAAVQVEKLDFTGTWHSPTGTGGNVGVGVEFVNTRNDNSKLEHIAVYKCDISGFMWGGVRVGGWSGKSGFRGVLITDTIVRGNGDVGIQLRGEFDRESGGYANEKVWVARCRVYSNSGIPDRAANSGNGILISDTIMGTVERTTAHHNGGLSDFTGAGPIGIFAFDAAKIVFHYNESHSNKTASNRDGAGFDFDSGVNRSFMENNYSHDNDGAGYLLGQFSGGRGWGPNVVRNNISQNDGRRNSYGGINLTGPPGPQNIIVEHNTIYLTPPASGDPVGIRVRYAGAGVQIRNNIIYTTGNLATIDVESSKAEQATFNGNAYWNPDGTRIRWKGVTYTDLETWRAASGREMDGVTPTGIIADPQLTAPGTGGSFNNAFRLHELAAYRLLPTSPLIDRAANLPPAFEGYAPSPFDYYVTRVTGLVRDVGAGEVV